MAIQKLLLDTNVIIDFMNRRDPHFDQTRMLMMCGRVGEFSLWIASSQVTDIIYILSNGGRKAEIPAVLQKLRALRTFVNVCPVSDSDIDKTLATTWSDPEDALLVELALKLCADAIITRDEDFPATDMIRVHDCPGFFKWLEDEKRISYAELDL